MTLHEEQERYQVFMKACLQLVSTYDENRHTYWHHRMAACLVNHAMKSDGSLYCALKLLESEDEYLNEFENAAARVEKETSALPIYLMPICNTIKVEQCIRRYTIDCLRRALKHGEGKVVCLH